MLRVARPELVNWNDVPNKRFLTMDYNINYKQSLSHASLNFWAHLDLISLLVELSDSGHIAEIRELFDQAIKLNPDLIIIVLS